MKWCRTPISLKLVLNPHTAWNGQDFPYFMNWCHIPIFHELVPNPNILRTGTDSLNFKTWWWILIFHERVLNVKFHEIALFQKWWPGNSASFPGSSASYPASSASNFFVFPRCFLFCSPDHEIRFHQVLIKKTTPDHEIRFHEITLLNHSPSCSDTSATSLYFQVSELS